MKRTDTELFGLVPRDKAERLHAARAVVAAYCEPGAVATVASVARQTGFSEAMVREILSSDRWDELVASQILHQIGPLIAKGTKLLADMIEDESESRHARMQAHRLALQTYDCIMRNRPAHQSGSSDDAFDALLQSLPKANAEVRDSLVQPTPTVLP